MKEALECKNRIEKYGFKNIKLIDGNNDPR